MHWSACTFAQSWVIFQIFEWNFTTVWSTTCPPTAKHSEAHYNREQLCLHCSQNNSASLGLDTWARHRFGSESLGEDTCSETFNKMIKRHSKQRLRKGNCFTLLSDRPTWVLKAHQPKQKKSKILFQRINRFCSHDSGTAILKSGA